MTVSDTASVLDDVRAAFLEAYGLVELGPRDDGALFRALIRLEGVSVSELLSGVISLHAREQARRSVMRNLGEYINSKTRMYSSTKYSSLVLQIMHALDGDEEQDEEEEA